MEPGKFIVFDGIDGSGKTTLSKAYAERIGALWTREPGGVSQFGKKMRELIMTEEFSDYANLFLFAADRQDHIHNTILPALAAGQDVVCDRYLLSTFVYQSKAWGLNPFFNELVMASAAVNGFHSPLLPDRLFLIDCSPEIALERSKARGQVDASRWDSGETEVVKERKRAYNRYLSVLERVYRVVKCKDMPVTCFTNDYRDIERAKSDLFLIGGV